MGEFDLGSTDRRASRSGWKKVTISGITGIGSNPIAFIKGRDQRKHPLFMNTGKSDLDLLLETGHTAFRTSIQWSRIFPEGRGEINQAGVDFYRRVFEKIKEKGIHPLGQPLSF